MTTIIDKIKLKDRGMKDSFIQWVQEVDYLACQKLPSVLSFQVCEVQDKDYEYLEIVKVTGLKQFEEDMETDTFGSLVEQFSEMADVCEQIVCTDVPPGYVAS